MMRVGIVGAGIAGLACAQRLSDHGIDVALFDKGKRPGGRLASVVVVGQSGFGIEYGADGAVRTLPVIADLGGSAEFTGDVPEGDIAAGATALYAFSVRASEIAATNGGQLILRVAVTGSAGLDAATPVIPAAWQEVPQ